MQCVVLQPKGTTRNANIPPSTTQLLTGAEVGKLLRRSTPAEAIGTWKWGALQLHLFGFKAGKAGTENKHELPPPHDEASLFGEAVILATQRDNGTLVTFTTSLFAKFYNDSARDDSDSEDDSDDEFDSDLEADAAEAEAEVEADDESDASSEATEVAEEEEPAPVPVRVPKPKRSNKKTPAWFSYDQLTGDESVGNTRTRMECQRRLTAFFAVHLSEDQRTDLEAGIYRFAVQNSKYRRSHAVWENAEFENLYEITARRVITNLDGRSYVSNDRLLDRLKEGEFKAWEVAFMTCQDLFPQKWVNLQEREMKREAKMLEKDTSMATDMFRCSRCGKRQCTYYEQQTRSADEPMTIFVRCVNCGKQWRQ